MWSRGCLRSTMIQVIASTVSIATVIAASCSQTTVYKTVPVSLTNFCSLKPCLNNGTCVTGTTSSLFSCICKQGYTGKVCENDVNECLTNNGGCSTNAICTKIPGSYTCACKPGYPGNGFSCADPADCHDWYLRGYKDSGVYTVMTGNSSQTPLPVYCDMNTNSRGWTVFQRREDGSEDFYRNWTDYQIGFGNISGEFWIGNDNLNLLTSAKRYKLRVDLTDFYGLTAYAEFDNFTVESAADKYRLSSAGTYSGNASDSLSYHVGQQFSTNDQDNDSWSSGNCAVYWKGAWWYNDCHRCNLNGRYYYSSQTFTWYYDGVTWYHWKWNYESLKRSEMKITPFV